MIDGPFIESKELIAGYTIIQVKSKKEAIEWAGFPRSTRRAQGRRDRGSPVIRAGGLWSQRGSETLSQYGVNDEEVAGRLSR